MKTDKHFKLITCESGVYEVLLEDGELFKIDKILIMICVIFNMFVVLLSGYIPTKMAGKRKIIDCINNRM